MAVPPFTLSPTITAPAGPSQALGEAQVEFFAPFNVGAASEPNTITGAVAGAVPWLIGGLVAWLVLRRR